MATSKHADVYEMTFYTPVSGVIADELMVTGILPDDFLLHGYQRFGNYVPLWDNRRAVYGYLKHFEDPHIVEIRFPYDLNGKLARIGPGVFGVRVVPPRYIAYVDKENTFLTIYSSGIREMVQCGGCGMEYSGIDMVPKSASSGSSLCVYCGGGVFIPVRKKEKNGKKPKEKKRSSIFANMSSDDQEVYFLQIIEYQETQPDSGDTIRELQDIEEVQNHIEYEQDYSHFRDRIGGKKPTYLQELKGGETFKFVGNRTVYRVIKKTDEGIFYEDPVTGDHYSHTDLSKAPRVHKVERTAESSISQIEAEPAEISFEDWFWNQKGDEELKRVTPPESGPRDSQIKD